MADDGNRYLVLVSFDPCTPERLMQSVPGLKATLEKMSSSPVEQLFRSVQADYCGYLMRSRRSASQIKQRLESPNSRTAVWDDDGWREPFLTNRDSLAVIEIGSDLALSQGLSRALTWFQRH